MSSPEENLSMNECTKKILLGIKKLKEPLSYRTGQQIKSGLVADNILIFQRSDYSAFIPRSIGTNYNQRFELIIILKQKTKIKVDEFTHVLEPGEALLVFPNQFHHFLDSQKQNFALLFISFDINSATSITSLKNNPKKLGKESFSHIHLLLENYLKLEKGAIADPIVTSFYLTNLLRILIHEPQITAKKDQMVSDDLLRDKLLEDVNQYIRVRLTQNLALPEIAKVLGYSSSHLQMLFRKHVKISLGKYIKGARLAEAARLLQFSDLNVTDISHQLGFKSVFSFSRAFKQAYKVSPKRYSLVMSSK